jgi:hypothetical protein
LTPTLFSELAVGLRLRKSFFGLANRNRGMDENLALSNLPADSEPENAVAFKSWLFEHGGYFNPQVQFIAGV